MNIVIYPNCHILTFVSKKTGIKLLLSIVIISITYCVCSAAVLVPFLSIKVFVVILIEIYTLLVNVVNIKTRYFIRPTTASVKVTRNILSLEYNIIIYNAKSVKLYYIQVRHYYNTCFIEVSIFMQLK